MSMPWSDTDDGGEPQESRSGSLIRRLVGGTIIALFVLLLVLSPIPMGANREWAWAPIALIVGALGVASAVGGLSNPKSFRVSSGERLPLIVLIVCFAILIAVGLLQMTSIFVPAGAARLYASAGKLLGSPAVAYGSLAVDQTRDVLLKCLTCGLIFAIARAICIDERRARLLLWSLLASALVVLAYALMMHVSTHSCFVGSYLKMQGQYSPVSDRCLMSGSFVSSNSFACFMGMAIVAAVGLIFDDSGASRDRGEDMDDEDATLGWLTGTRVALIAVILAMMGGLLISSSRAGFAASVVSALALIALLMRGRWRSRAHFAGAILGGVAVALIIGVIAGSSFIRKVSNLSEADSSNRLVIWRASAEAIRQSPWLGWGLGNFTDIYTVLQPPEIPMANDKAHSTPIETMVEVGIPASIPVMATVILPWLVCLQGAFRRRRQRYLPAVAFAISGVAILHSIVDFSLQIPAIAFWVSAALGLGWAQAFTRKSRGYRHFATES